MKYFSQYQWECLFSQHQLFQGPCCRFLNGKYLPSKKIFGYLMLFNIDFRLWLCMNLCICLSLRSKIHNNNYKLEKWNYISSRIINGYLHCKRCTILSGTLWLFFGLLAQLTNHKRWDFLHNICWAFRIMWAIEAFHNFGSPEMAK